MSPSKYFLSKFSSTKNKEIHASGKRFKNWNSIEKCRRLSQQLNTICKQLFKWLYMDRFYTIFLNRIYNA